MVSSRKTPQGGFTLIELVVVIVILGILAAFAIPRFANIAKDARVSALNGLAGSLRSTSALIHGMALAQNQGGATGTVTLEGLTINLINGYPKASVVSTGGIIDALSNLDPTTYTVLAPASGSITITVAGSAVPATTSAATPTGCSVSYSQATAVGLPATVTVSTTLQTDC